jgi:hypothetical protein
MRQFTKENAKEKIYKNTPNEKFHFAKEKYCKIHKIYERKQLNEQTVWNLKLRFI